MKPSSRAYEIGYSKSLEVIDHSEVLLAGQPGTAAFEKMLPQIHDRLDPLKLYAIEQARDLLRQMYEWVAQPDADQTFRMSDSDFTVTWHRPAPRAGIYSIYTGLKIATVSLAVCRLDDAAPAPSLADEHRPLFALMEKLSDAGLGELPYDHRKFHLISMTQRPLLASVFWPPFLPTEPCWARHIQLLMAYAFFGVNGEID